jgi:8-oxo-dGTP pyrophosphatase MutT (NUDIX family)
MKNPFTLVSSEIKYQNPWIEVREDIVIRPWWKKGIFWVVKIQDGCTILALDKDNRVWVTHEYCYGVWEERRELPSWWIDLWEEILHAAQRELLEETGLISDDWIYLWYTNPFTTVISSKNHMFIAKNVIFKKSCPEEWEIIKVKQIPFDELYEQALSWEIKHAASTISILKAKVYLS